MLYKARYERVIDTGSSGNMLSSFTINGNTSCAYTVDYKLAGSDNIFDSATTLYEVYPGVEQQIMGVLPIDTYLSQ